MANQSGVWLITGASSGFGAALSEIVLRAGYSVIATARNTEKAASSNPHIQSLGGKWLQLDVNEQDTSQKIDRAIREAGRIDVVVNNAGYSLIGSFEDMSEPEIQQQMNTNFHGPLRVIKGALPHLKSRKSGTIVNITSLAGLEGVPCVSLYSASKFALEGFSEALAGELTPFNVRVLLIEPGSFRTDFLNAFVTPAAGISKDYEGTAVETVIKTFREKTGKQPGDPIEAARRIYEVVTGTGLGVDTKVLRVILGSDCLERARQKVVSFSNNLDLMETIAKSTDYRT